MKEHKYTVTARPAIPDPAPELRYVAMEREYARREGAKLAGRWWPFFSYPALGILRHRDWVRYEHALDKYEHQVTRHNEEIRDGLVPCSLVVHHDGPAADRRILVRVEAEHGSFHLHKQAPKRPKRIDGAPDRAEGPRFRGFGGFVRRGIEMRPHNLQAELSELGPNDSARLVNQAVYLECAHPTRLRYNVKSEAVPEGVHGEIEL